MADQIITRRKEIIDVAKGLTAEPIPEKEIHIDENTPMLSTGSTLLDLAICGDRIYGGGIPGGILVEIYGPSGYGKTTILGEICANAQSKGGFAMIGDAERRMKPDFIQIMGIKITKDNLKYPHTIEDLEELIFDIPETGGNIIDVTGVDSTASLISSAELKITKSKNSDGEETEAQTMKKDKRGSAKAKDLHSLCRRAKIEMSKNNRLIVFTNQIQDVQTEGFGPSYGPKEKTPGGHAVPFYASLRLRCGAAKISKITKKVKIAGNDISEDIGIRSLVKVTKSSIGAPFREAEICIVFDYGIDDLRANLEYIKKMTGSNQYWAVDNQFKSIKEAIYHIEKMNYEKELQTATINLWYEIKDKFKEHRKVKNRG